MDIKAEITKMVEIIKNDPEIAELFKKDHIKAIEKIIGVDTPDDAVEKIVEGVKAKINLDKASDALGKLKKLF